MFSKIVYRTINDSNRFKAQVAVEAIRDQRTIAGIASEYGIHPSQTHKWKKQALEELPNVFSDNHERSQ